MSHEAYSIGEGEMPQYLYPLIVNTVCGLLKGGGHIEKIPVEYTSGEADHYFKVYRTFSIFLEKLYQLYLL
jgi:hypothetical protein